MHFDGPWHDDFKTSSEAEAEAILQMPMVWSGLVDTFLMSSCFLIDADATFANPRFKICPPLQCVHMGARQSIQRTVHVKVS